MLPLPGPAATPVAVVVDVLRATSTVVTALACGCRAVIPAETVEEAWRLVDTFPDRAQVIVGGERGGLAPPGFDRGNSPREYTAGVAGKILVLTTTNGTRAVRRAGSDLVLVMGFLNLPAVVEYIAHRAQSVTVICAGTAGRFSWEDFACAGMLVHYLEERGTSFTRGDGALAAAAAYRSWPDDLPSLLGAGNHGRRLVALGLGEDLEFCGRAGVYAVVPVYRGNRIVLDSGGATCRGEAAEER